MTQFIVKMITYSLHIMTFQCIWKFCRVFIKAYFDKLNDTRFRFGDSKVLQKICEYLKLSFDTHRNEMIRIYQSTKPSLEIYDDTKVLIEKFISNKNKLGIITNGGKNTQSNKIDLLSQAYPKLWNFIYILIAGEHFSKEDWKPSNKPFSKMKEYFLEKKLLKGKLYYIGNDASRDIKGAVEEGYSVIIRPKTDRDFLNLEDYNNETIDFTLVYDLKKLIQEVD